MHQVQTPCYVLDESRLINNLKLINYVQQEAGIEIILAFKGFAMWSVFPLFRNYIKSATASSLHEARLCVEEMKNLAHTYCVAYDPDGFGQIVAYSSHLTFNSLTQYQQFVERVPDSVSIGLRVNPGRSGVETDMYNPSIPTSRLGATEVHELPTRIEGLHFHVLCESDSYTLEKVLTSFESKFGHLIGSLKWINFGGGHLMTRKGYDINHLIELLKKFKERYQVDIILEPGSAFAWETGYLYASVLDVVENGGIKTAIIDVSFSCHMPDCLEVPYRPDISGSLKDRKEGCHAYRIGGVSCLAGDHLETYWFEHPLSVGDQITFKDMMHYTMVKTTMFNGIKHPSISIQRSSGEFESIREFGYEDFKGRLS